MFLQRPTRQIYRRAVWQDVQSEFGGPREHSCDLMAFDSNAMSDMAGRALPHFTPWSSPESAGVNMFAQDFFVHRAIMQFPYVFPPTLLVGPVLFFLRSVRQLCTMVVLDVYPRKYWWPLLLSRSRKSLRVALKGDSRALLVPSQHGWIPHP